MRRFLIALLFLASYAHAQTTTVSGTVTDSDSISWQNGTITFTLTSNNPNIPPSVGGVPLTKAQQKFTIPLDGSGSFSTSVSSTDFIQPISLWSITICSNTSAPCASLVNMQIKGATQNITATISGQIQPIRLAAGYSTRAYADVEITPIPVAGGTYYNTVSNLTRQWNGTSWVAGSGGAVPFVTPESYGAIGNTVYRFDGATTAATALTATLGFTTTLTSPAVTTNLNNEMVLSIFGTNSAWTSAPSGGGTTNRVNVPYAASEFGAYVSDQTVATAGSVAGITGTQTNTSAGLMATVSLACATGGCSFVNAQSAIAATGFNQTVNVPAGVTNGDTLVACVNWFQNGVQTNFVATTSGWGVPIVNMMLGANTPGLICCTRKAYSEPASYTFFQNVSSGITTFILAYRNSIGLDGATLTSATANFTSADVGKLLCVAGVANQFNVVTGGQMCGAITGYNSSSSVLTSLAASPGSGFQFAYGSDDTTAFQNMLTACAPIGCRAILGAKQYAISQMLTIPAQVPTIIEGAGSGQVNTENNYLNGSAFTNSNGGTRLVILTQGETTTAIYATGLPGFAASDTATDVIQNVAILGGAGKTRDGGGGDCIRIINWQNFKVQGVSCANFVGRGAYTDGINGYIEAIVFDHFFSYWNNGVGIQIGSASSANFLETVGIYNSVFENNGSNGVYIGSGGGYEGLTLINNVIQWNNINVAGNEIQIDHNISGCEIRGNYLEVDTVGGSKSTGPWNVADHGCNFGQNFIIGSIYGNTFHVDTVGTVHISGLAPTAGAGTLTGNNNGGQVTGLSAATTLTITFANGGWSSWDACHASTSVSGNTASITTSSLAAMTITFSSALTGTAYYHCDGN